MSLLLLQFTVVDPFDSASSHVSHVTLYRESPSLKNNTDAVMFNFYEFASASVDTLSTPSTVLPRTSHTSCLILFPSWTALALCGFETNVGINLKVNLREKILLFVPRGSGKGGKV